MPIVDYWKLAVLEKYAVFEGRSRRAEFWWFALANFIVLVVLAILINVSNAFWVLYIGYALALLVPSIAVAIRRLHDTGKSGWWLLLSLIPFGGIVLLVFYLIDSTPGTNQYGVSPKYPDA